MGSGISVVIVGFLSCIFSVFIVVISIIVLGIRFEVLYLMLKNFFILMLVLNLVFVIKKIDEKLVNNKGYNLFKNEIKLKYIN